MFHLFFTCQKSHHQESQNIKVLCKNKWKFTLIKHVIVFDWKTPIQLKVM